MAAPRGRLAGLLGGSKTAGAFSARLEAPAVGLGLEVAGAGPVRLPLRTPQVKRLVAVARPALFGRGEQTLSDTIDDEITLGWWTAPDGTGGEEISLRVQDYEVCTSTANADLTPYDSQYEGYMGNYGNTLDRWYRRAAVVVWPRERAFRGSRRGRIEVGPGGTARRHRAGRPGPGARPGAVPRPLLEAHPPAT